MAAAMAAAMAGQHRFERVDFRARKAGGGMSGSEPEAQQAEAEIRLLLSDGEWHSRADIVEALRGEGIGRVAGDSALCALEAAGMTCARREGRGGPSTVRLNDAAIHDRGEAAVSADDIAPPLEDVPDSF